MRASCKDESGEGVREIFGVLLLWGEIDVTEQECVILWEDIS